uniref:Uncharacterized protein n=1 Tax=Calcidiscus leptoporus TaxID=127549 RepID=A0A7S0NX67_9EUKA
MLQRQYELLIESEHALRSQLAAVAPQPAAVAAGVAAGGSGACVMTEQLDELERLSAQRRAQVVAANKVARTVGAHLAEARADLSLLSPSLSSTQHEQPPRG